MSVWESLFLGFIQGITEFLPVSSSGHLVLFQKIFGVQNHDILFDVFAHLGTLFAVLIIYYESIKEIVFPIFKHSKKSEQSKKVFSYVILASIPTALIGFSLKDFFEALFMDMKSVGICFFITGFILYFTKNKGADGKALDMLKGLEGIETLSAKKSFLIGISQALAICPGISRSGSTISAALYMGVRRDTASLFSFLIAIPAIIGATLLQITKVEAAQMAWQNYAIGFFSAFFFGYLGLKSLIQIVKKGSLSFFSLYLWILGLACFIYG